MQYDKESFLAGLQLGRRLKAMEARTVIIPVWRRVVVMEYGTPIITEDGKYIVPEGPNEPGGEQT